MVVILIETLHNFCVLYFASIYRIFLVLIFANGKFLKISTKKKKKKKKNRASESHPEGGRSQDPKLPNI